MKSIVALVLFSLLLSLGITSHAKTPDGETPAVEDVCDGEVGAAYGLCNAYCEAMDCDSDYPNASDKACARVEANYEKKTGELPPCVAVDPCAEFVDDNQENECPCNYFDVPMTEACWIRDTKPGFNQCFSGSCLDFPGDNCGLRTFQGGFMGIVARNIGNLNCTVNDLSSESCMGPEPMQVSNLSEAQFLTCLCRIEQYANELEGVAGIDISNGDPQFSCSRCGNGALDGEEACDDGNTLSGDGCSNDCSIIEPGFECPVPGEPCTEVAPD